MPHSQPRPAPQVGLTVGQRIKLARQRRGMSALELARRVDSDQRAIQRIEAGELRAGAARLERIAYALGVPIAALVLPTLLRPDPEPFVGLDDEDD